MINQQLPISPRDSRHLLSLLNTSFTEALDKEYPKVSSKGRNTTDEHVHSILSNPIFGPKPPVNSSLPKNSPHFKNHTRTTATDLSKPAIHGPMESLSVANAMTEFQVKSFRSDILTGRADLPGAMLCLRRSMRDLKFISNNHGSQALNGLGKHGIASMMLNWLWSSGLEKSDEVLLHTNFLPLLSPFLVVEGRLAEAMQWFLRLDAKATLYPSDDSLSLDGTLAVCLENAERSREQLLALLRHRNQRNESTEVKRACDSYVRVAFNDGYLLHWPRMLLRRRQQAMLHHLVVYSLAQGPKRSLDTAINTFVQAINSSDVGGMSPIELTSVFRLTGRLVVKQIENGWTADQSGYDAFSSTVPLWNNTNDVVQRNLVPSIIKLHDPSNPDWGPASFFLSKLTPTIVKGSTLWERRRMVSLGLVTAKMLLSDDRSSYARRAKKIMESLQQLFGDEPGTSTKSLKETRKPHLGLQVEPMVTNFALAG
ncbi:MAG: hypothetical protein Q9195_004877 [Heterodermia aff. obscurata]